MGERCTVFMESDLVSHQQNGASKKDLCAGLAVSVVSRRRITDGQSGYRALSADATAERISRALAAGAEAYLAKPLSLVELLQQWLRGGDALFGDGFEPVSPVGGG